MSSVDRGAGEGVKIVLMKRKPDGPVGQDVQELDEDHGLADALAAASLALKLTLASGEDSEQAFADYNAHVAALIADCADEYGAEDTTATTFKCFDQVMAEIAARDDDVVDLDKRRRRMKPTAKPDPDKDKSEPNGKPINSKQTAKGSSTMVDMVAEAAHVCKGEASRFTKLDFRREIDKRAQAYALTAGVGFHKAWMEITQAGGEAATLFSAMRKAEGADCTAEEAASTGTAAQPSAASSPAYERLQALADDLRKREPELSKEQAFNKIYTSRDPDHRELVQAERTERRARAMGASA